MALPSSSIDMTGYGLSAESMNAPLPILAAAPPSSPVSSLIKRLDASPQ